MQLSGKQTTNVKVDVSAYELVEATEKLFYKVFSKYDGYSHISKDGYWYLYDGEDHHNGDIEWKRGEKATQEEIADNWKHKTFMSVLGELKKYKENA